jgi:hypothetical protein
VKRPKVRASLLHSPSLAARIGAGRTEDATGTINWKPEDDRVHNVIVKLARGHVAHQYSEPQLDDPTQVAVMPLATMSDEQRASFETVPETHGWPEIGSRAFVNLIVADDVTYDLESGWNILQQGRYRYMVAQPGETIFRIVLSDYLAAEVVW